MNAGYFSYVWMTCFIILLSSGWQEQLMGHFNKWMVMFFIGLWFVLMPLSLQLTPHVTIHLSIIVIIAVTIVVYRTVNSRTQWLQLLLFSILLSIWHGFMVYGQRFSHMNLINPALDVALGEALLTAGLIKNPLRQMAVISWGVIVGLSIEKLWSGSSHIQIGHGDAWDQIFLAVICTRTVSLLAQWLRNRLYSS